MLRFGVDYYPEHWPEDRWSLDAQLMQEAGFNTVRLAEFAWSRLEPRPDDFRFDWLDRAMDLLADHGMQIVLGTPTASPPPWVISLYPDALRMKESGQRQTYGNRREYCPSHPGYRARSRAVTAAMAAHYADHPAVIGWQTDNEFGDRCYCPICRGEFHIWLQQKYGTLDAVNAAWGTGFWSHEYTEWSQIPPPLATSGYHGPHGSPNPGLALDYYRFISDTYVDFQHEQVEILRAHCPDHFICHNLMGFGYDQLNYFDLVRELDLVTWDNYRRMQWTFGRPIDPSAAALAHATMRGLKQQPFWVMEQQSGSGGWEIVAETPRPGELRLWTYQGIAHGADGIIYFRWRTARVGTEQYWHGILDHDGTPRRRYTEVKQLGEELKTVGPLVAGATNPAEVAIWLSYDARFAFQIQANHPNFNYGLHVQDIYRALHDRNVPVDIIEPGPVPDHVKLLIVPAFHVVTDGQAQALAAFVDGGGTLVVTPRTGVKDEANAVVDLPLPGLLAGVCGVTVEEYCPLPVGQEQPLAFAPDAGIAGSGRAALWCDVLDPGQAEVVARYTADYFAGAPAVTLHRQGQGRAVYVGTFGDDALYAALVPWWLELAGVDAGFVTPAGVELVQRVGAQGPVWALLNHTAAPVRVTLPRSMVNVWAAATGAVGEVELPAYDVVFLAEGEDAA